MYPGLVPAQSLDVCTIPVQAGESLTIRLRCEGLGCGTNGIQILPLVGTTFCPQGPNSTGGTVELSAWASSAAGGAVSIAANDLVIAAGITGAPIVSPGTAVLIWASDSVLTNPMQSNCPLIGTRCVGAPGGGSLIRASVGTQTNFGTDSGAIDLAMLANPMGQPGLNVLPGNSLYFQMIYRDNDAFNVCPTTAIARWTEAIEIALIP